MAIVMLWGSLVRKLETNLQPFFTHSAESMLLILFGDLEI